MPKEPIQYLTVKEAAEILRMCPMSVIRRIKEGKLRSFRVGARTLLRRDWLDQDVAAMATFRRVIGPDEPRTADPLKVIDALRAEWKSKTQRKTKRKGRGNE